MPQVEALLEPDRDQLEIFADCIFRHAGGSGFVSLRAFFEEDAITPFRITPIALTGGFRFLMDAVEDDSRRAAQHPKSVVFCPPLAVFRDKDHAREEDILQGLALSVECDQRPHQARKILENLLGPATVVVRSGGRWLNGGEPEDKLHLHWRLKTPAQGKEALAKLKEARTLAARLVGGDPSNKPVCHPIRWPGSWHRKAEPRLCEIEHAEPDIEIELDDALTKLRAAGPADSERDGNNNVGNDSTDMDSLVASIITGASYHHPLTRLAAQLSGAGLYDGQNVKLLRALMKATPASEQQTPRWQGRFGEIPRIVRSACEKFQSSGPIFDPWQQHIVPGFPIDVLPPVAQTFVAEQAVVIGCDPAGLAMSVLATFSGALNHNFALRLMRNGSWWASPRLWIVLVAPPSGKKTPIFNAATGPLVRYEQHLREGYEKKFAAYKQALEAGDKAATEPERPPRYVAWDTTVEKLGEILARDIGKGMLIKSDELSGWLSSMERYANSGSDRAFWLQAYDGGPHAIDRIKRGELYIPNLSLSVVGGIQPAKLAEVRESLSTDGLLQRFVPTMLRAPTLPQDRPNDDEDYGKLIRQMIFAAPAKLIMTDEALAVMEELREHLFNLEQAGSGMAPGFETFIGKLPGVCGNLALLLHIAHDPEHGATYAVERRTAEGVRRLVVDFILPHALEFYYGSGNSPGERLRRIASWILTSGKQRILASDVTAAITECRGLTLNQMNERLSPLVAGGWLIPADSTPVCRAWTVAPAVHTQFAQRTAAERERKARVMDLMGRASRKSGKST